MDAFQVLFAVAGGLVATIVGGLTWVIKDHHGRITQVERQCISQDQMEKFVELKQAPLYLLLERMADDIHQLRRLMERQYDKDKDHSDRG